jgi:hypothetical protein
MNMEIWTEAAQFPEKENKGDFPCSAYCTKNFSLVSTHHMELNTILFNLI